MSEYIDREKFLERLSKKYPGMPPLGAIVVQLLCDEAPADVRPVVRGRWVQIDDYPHEDWECDVCGKQLFGDEYIPRDFKFCPNCGADMREDKP